MRTFIYQDAKSNKFWHIDPSGAGFTVHFGRVGTDGQKQVKTFADEATARREADKLIADKLKKGYVETTAPTGPAALRKALEDAILDNPSDTASHAAYADLLTEAGDPRGEFIQLHLTLEDDSMSQKRRSELSLRAAALLAEHGDEWIGEWATMTTETESFGRGQLPFTTPVPCRFLRGILAEATFTELDGDCARAFAQAPQTRLIRRLFLGSLSYEDEDQIEEDVPVGAEATWNALCKWPHFANLRVFQFGWTAEEEYGERCWNQCHLDGTKIHTLVARMPRLEELYLFASGINTEKLFGLPSLTNLRVLQVYHSWDYALETLAGNARLGRLPHLTHLLLHPKAVGSWSGSEVYITHDGVRALLDSPLRHTLTHLRLRLTRLGDAGCELFVASGVLARLQQLDLRHGCITDDGARILAACPDLKKLKLLDLAHNQLTEVGIARLQATGVPLRAEHQHDEEGDDAPEYLMEGDYE